MQAVNANDPQAAAPWAPAIERTVTGLGYELVEVERAPRGLLRVTIDRLPGHRYPGPPLPGPGDADAAALPASTQTRTDEEPAGFVTVDDCERVTRQLQYVLDLEGVPYERLEVSSPGLDRPLRRTQDYERFSGAQVELTLRAPLQGRKRFKGALGRGDAGDAWRLVFDEGRGEQALEFRLDEVREARLVPVLDFKGRSRGGTPRRADAAAPARRGARGKQGKGGARGAAADGGLER